MSKPCSILAPNIFVSTQENRENRERFKICIRYGDTFISSREIFKQHPFFGCNINNALILLSDRHWYVFYIFKVGPIRDPTDSSSDLT